MQSNYIDVNYKLPELRVGDLVLLNREISVFSKKPFPKERFIVGFMGTACEESDTSGKIFKPTSEDKELGQKIGEMIAAKGAILSNGAVWGLPYYPVQGANLSGGYTFGISPYSDRKSHERKGSPIKNFDLILYAGINCPHYQRADYTFRDWLNTLYPDIVMSAGGVIGTPDEDLHFLEQGGIFIPIRGTGGATDWLISGIEKGIFNKDTGTVVIIADKTLKGLESAIDQGLKEARTRWEKDGRTQNRFSHVIGELEKVIL